MNLCIHLAHYRSFSLSRSYLPVESSCLLPVNSYLLYLISFSHSLSLPPLPFSFPLSLSLSCYPNLTVHYCLLHACSLSLSHSAIRFSRLSSVMVPRVFVLLLTPSPKKPVGLVVTVISQLSLTLLLSLPLCHPLLSC